LYSLKTDDTQIEQIKNDITGVMVRNVGIGVIASFGCIALLQRVFPSYGGQLSFTNSVIDAGVFMLFTGGATLLSLN